MWYTLGSLVVAALAAFVIVRYRTRHARREARLTFAYQHGWIYRATDPKLADRLAADGLGHTRFAGGHGRDVFSGTDRKRAFLAFTTTLSATSSTVTLGVVSVRLDHELPDLAVLPLPADDWLDLAGGRPVESGQPDFDQGYVVTLPGADPSGSAEYAQALLGDGLVDWLLADGRVRRPYAIAGADLLTWQEGDLEPAAIEPALADLAGFAAALDPTVLTRFGRAIPGTKAARDEKKRRRRP